MLRTQHAWRSAAGKWALCMAQSGALPCVRGAQGRTRMQVNTCGCWQTPRHVPDLVHFAALPGHNRQ